VDERAPVVRAGVRDREERAVDVEERDLGPEGLDTRPRARRELGEQKDGGSLAQRSASL